MKNQFSLSIILLLCIQLFISSCSETDDSVVQPEMEEKETVKDDDDENDDSVGNNHVIAEELSNQVIIKGSTKAEGIAPSQKGTITLHPVEPTNGNIALLDEGFELPLFVDSDADVVGAYIEFGVVTNSDGVSAFSSASNHYDVNLADNDQFAKSGVSNKYAKNRIEKYAMQSAKFSYALLDVDFSSEITDGEICYYISVYDANGNISDAQQICMTVVEWGNSTDFTGVWDYTKHESYPPEGDTIVTAVGVEDCTDDSLACANGGTLDFSYCTTINGRSYEFKADGTYEFNSDESIVGMNYQAAYDTCESNSVAYDNVIGQKGKWTYNDVDNSIILAEYEATYNHSIDGTSNYTNELGSAYVSRLTKINLANGAFSYGWPLTGIDINGDGLINDDDSGYANFFDKK
ncbi:hypothetical protein JQC67_08660 [Aurantibacter crassamenti]|uniref:hypothetical protein n=1 Tax=Aurantibacter crassamenti TaxID=1837375 RepID=UPI001939E973|nr:hypothetical protein [Aurantibacter crassamenti]MBM1106204.1 hypothetical protein [Aurantibacter crassamenti]